MERAFALGWRQERRAKEFLLKYRQIKGHDPAGPFEVGAATPGPAYCIMLGTGRSRERAETMGERFSKSELEVQAQRPWSGADTCNCGNRLPGIMKIARQTPRLGLRATGDGGQRWRALLGAQCLWAEVRQGNWSSSVGTAWQKPQAGLQASQGMWWCLKFRGTGGGGKWEARRHGVRCKCSFLEGFTKCGCLSDKPCSETNLRVPSHCHHQPILFCEWQYVPVGVNTALGAHR